MIKIIEYIYSILVMIVLITCLILFGINHNYPAMWATLIFGFFGIIGMMGMASILDDYMRFKNLDSIKKLPNDIQINLNKETTERFLKQFFNEIGAVLHDYRIKKENNKEKP